MAAPTEAHPFEDRAHITSMEPDFVRGARGSLLNRGAPSRRNQSDR